MQKGDKFIYINEITKKSQKATYTGVRREVKGCLFDFFDMEDGTCCFFYPNEIKEPMFVKIED